MLQTTIQSGFARSRSEALFPRLFPDFGWWCPSLQSLGGTRLHDLRGSNWGTLNSMAPLNAWITSSGKGALNNLGTGHVEAVNPIVPNTGRFSLSIWVHVNSHPGGSQGLFSVGGIAANSGPYEILISASQTIFGTGGNGWCIFSALPVGRWLHLVCAQNGTSAGSTSIFIDGAQITPTANNAPSINAFGSRTFFFMRREATTVSNCLIDDARGYRRGLTAGDARQLYYLGRGNMPMVRKRRYTEEAAQATNRRRRLICGSNS